MAKMLLSNVDGMFSHIPGNLICERGVLPTGVLPIGVFPTGVLPNGVFPTAGGDSPTSRLQLGVPLQLQFSLKIRLLSIKDIVC